MLKIFLIFTLTIATINVIDCCWPPKPSTPAPQSTTPATIFQYSVNFFDDKLILNYQDVNRNNSRIRAQIIAKEECLVFGLNIMNCTSISHGISHNGADVKFIGQGFELISGKKVDKSYQLNFNLRLCQSQSEKFNFGTTIIVSPICILSKPSVTSGFPTFETIGDLNRIISDFKVNDCTA